MFGSRHLPFASVRFRRSAGRRLWRPLVGVGALLFLMADDGIGSDELACEIAVTQIARCCPGLAVESISCVHGGCDSNLRPDIEEPRAQCIQARSCDELRNQGACDTGLWELHPACLAMGTTMPTCQIKVPPCR